MALVDGLPSVKLDNVTKLIHQKISKNTASLVQTFSGILYGTLSSIDLVDRNDSDIYGATLSLWNALSDHQYGIPIIKVFNPEVSKNGWKSSHTIIEIIVNDMPFLVDSIRIALNRMGISPHLMLHCPLKVVRTKDHKIAQIEPSVENNLKNASTETVFFIEIDRQTENSDLTKITHELLSVVNDISLAVADWKPMKANLSNVINGVKKEKLPCSKEEKEDSIAFLEWVLNDNFTLLGYRSYSMKRTKGDIVLHANSEGTLGLMRQSKGDLNRLISTFSESARELALGSNLLILTKTNSRSRVHRPAQLDYIGVKRFDEKGNVIGEDRFIGLFGSAFYTSSVLDLPLIKSKVLGVCNMSNFAPNTHAYKTLANILETYPRDEILQTPTTELLKNVLGIYQMQER